MGGAQVNPNTSSFIPDWNQKYRTQADMERDLEIKYVGPGWYVNEKDQALIFEFEEWWYVAMYNYGERDMREIFRQIAGLPVIQAKGSE
jgi:hypothetical protein